MITIFSSLKMNPYLYNGIFNLFLLAGLIIEAIGTSLLITYYYSDDKKGLIIRLITMLLIIMMLITYYMLM
jgi:hypothetical protein